MVANLAVGVFVSVAFGVGVWVGRDSRMPPWLAGGSVFVGWVICELFMCLGGSK